MSEKRFIVENERTVYDNLFHRGYVCSWKIDAEELVGLLNEQQATISQLQDLCGESDGENAKLRIENKKLKEMNEQLRNQNKKLKWDLEKTREDLNYFATLKVTAMKGSEPK